MRGVLGLSILGLLAGCGDKESAEPDPADSGMEESVEGDGDGSPVGEDCDDADPRAFPGASEVCGDDIDNDCDGTVNEADAPDASTWHPDEDGDGYGDATVSARACLAPEGWLSDGSDCDDDAASVSPAGVEICNGVDDDCDALVDDRAEDAPFWYQDSDGDGWGASAEGVSACEAPEGWIIVTGDCNDANPSVNPGATETCDGMDDDCDGVSDEADAADAAAWYRDGDGDGSGDPLSPTAACREPSGYVADSTDCDDGRPDVHPGAEERCDGLDNDCDAVVDEADATDATTWYADGDGDGFGVLGTSERACDVPSGMVADSTDCDDARADIFPGAVEVCDGLDQDCDRLVDEVAMDRTTWHLDGDGDGFGDPDSSTVACEPPTAHVEDASDCDDGDSTVHPGAGETCNGMDDDCDGAVDDDALDAPTWFEDRDGDGHGTTDASVEACEAPDGYTGDATDCDDGRFNSHPGADEYCNGVDDDCDGSTDESDSVDASTWYFDADGDTYGDPESPALACTAPAGAVFHAEDCDDGRFSIHPGATESCDDVDNNCDGAVDEAVTLTFYLDEDGDGYGDPGSAFESCFLIAGAVSDGTDCDDTAPHVHPGMAEEPGDGEDDDCDGCADEVDADGDGYDSCVDCDDTTSCFSPEAPEIAMDGIDNNCDGLVDVDDGLCYAEVEFESDVTCWFAYGPFFTTDLYSGYVACGTCLWLGCYGVRPDVVSWEGSLAEFSASHLEDAMEDGYDWGVWVCG